MAKNGTVAYVSKLPQCDLHAAMGAPGVEAKYDFKMKQGPWANGCEACWKDNRAFADLGLGKGQKLEVRA